MGRGKQQQRSSTTNRKSKPPRRSPYSKPNRRQLEAAHDQTIPDCLGPGLQVLFVGINPSLYSAAVGHHFARPGNRFWPALFASGWTPRLFHPWEDQELVPIGVGLTNLVARATARADQLTAAELRRGATVLKRKIRRFRPATVAVVGVSAYRLARQQPQAGMGRQPQPLAGAPLWVLPNPSGLNAHYQLDDLAALYRMNR